MFNRFMSCAAFGVISLFVAAPANACAGHACNLASDWLTQGLAALPGTSVSVRFDYVPQTQLRLGSKVVNRSAIVFPVDDEIELKTRNYYANLAVDHSFNKDWGINVSVPVQTRPHSTIPEGETDISTSRTRGVGDVKAVARYQGFGGRAITGIQFGLKLPTGKFRQKFRTGPEAGEDVDRALQNGTGTADAIIGIYRFGKLSGSFDYILQAQGQIPLNSRAHFRTGVDATISGGIDYTGFKTVTPQLQINLRVAGKEKGDASDRPNSGGEQLYISPGLSVKISPKFSTFGVVQLPLYQRGNGFQLFAKYNASLGLQYRL
jgi:hypothetical protein